MTTSCGRPTGKLPFMSSMLLHRPGRSLRETLEDREIPRRTDFRAQREKRHS